MGTIISFVLSIADDDRTKRKVNLKNQKRKNVQRNQQAVPQGKNTSAIYTTDCCVKKQAQNWNNVFSPFK